MINTFYEINIMQRRITWGKAYSHCTEQRQLATATLVTIYVGWVNLPRYKIFMM